MTEVDTTGAWLSREDLDNARDRLPILYVHAIPVRVDDRGVVTHVGLLLRADSDGGIGQEVVGGRVLYHERIRDALCATSRATSARWRSRGSRCRRSRSRSPSSSRRPASRPSTTRASTPSRWPSSSRSWATAGRSRTPSTCPG